MRLAHRRCKDPPSSQTDDQEASQEPDRDNNRTLAHGTFVIPNLLLGALIALPFIDRSPKRVMRQRPIVITIGLLTSLLIIGLTAWGILTPPVQEPQDDSILTNLDPVEHGQLLFTEMKCITCHTIAGSGGTQGPDLHLLLLW